MTDGVEDRLARLELTSYTGHAYRQQSPGYDPRSGVGARRRGGRFNPPRSYPVLYLTLSVETAAAELQRSAQRTGLSLAEALPREVFRYDVSLSRVLDLREVGTLEQLGVTREELLAGDQARSRQIGEGAARNGIQAILAPSATETGEVLAVILDNLGTGRCDPSLVTVWASVADVHDL